MDVLVMQILVDLKWEELPRVAGCARVHGTGDDNERKLGGAGAAGHHCGSEKVD